MSNVTKKLEAEARILAGIRAEKEDLEEQLKAVNKRMQHQQTQVLPPLIQALGDNVKSFKIEGLGTVSLTNEAYVSVLADNRDRLHADLKESGNGDLITESVHPQTLRSWTLEQLKEGNALPDVIKVTYQPTAKLRKA